MSPGRYHLEPLSREDSERYIDHRLKIAGGLGNIFEDNAKREVYKLSNGVPRLINVICDRALLGAFSLEVRKVSQQIVRKAAVEVSGELDTRNKRKWLLPAIGLLTAAAVVAGVWAMTRAPQSPRAQPVSILLENEIEPLVTQAETPAPVPRPSPEPQQPSLDSVLQESGSLTTSSAAMRTLLSIWNVDYDRNNAPTCAQAEAVGLSCLSKRGSWSVLRQLDKPVALTLADSDGRTHNPVVVAIDDDSAELMIGEQRLTYPIPEIASAWYGQYLLIWQPPNGDSSILQVGARGPKVSWLRQSLVALSPDPSLTVNDSDIFDAELEQQLLDFQRRNRLQMDGLAGQQTQIIINSLLGLDGRPSLSSGPG